MVKKVEIAQVYFTPKVEAQGYKNNCHKWNYMDFYMAYYK